MPLQATSGAASYDAFGGGVVAEPNYIESCFSTWLYTGNGSTQTITNGIDLLGKGGLVWAKIRDQAYYHGLSGPDFATSYFGGYGGLRSNQTVGLGGTDFTGVTSTGFTLGSLGGDMNFTGGSYVSWTFRKQPKFFDVVTWTGTGTDPLTISHNLQSVPGCIIVKCTSTANWRVHSAALNMTLTLNTTNAGFSPDGLIKNLTSTTFQVNNSADVNSSGQTYVAYLFAHNAGGFGLTGTDNVISCGSFTTDGSGNASVNLGYEPQWLMTKCATNPGFGTNWSMLDTMRGWTANGPSAGNVQANLIPNLSNAESNNNQFQPNATGFTVTGSFASSTIIYIAIRRGPMKTPTDGTTVFAPFVNGATTTPGYVTSFPPDFCIAGSKDFTDKWYAVDRLRGAVKLDTASTSAEASQGGVAFYQNGAFSQDWQYGYNSWVFRRAPGFFDEVCYTGTGVARSITHNLTVVPELVICKGRNVADFWPVYSAAIPAQSVMALDFNIAPLTSQPSYFPSAPTSTVINVGNNQGLNGSGFNYVAYLFASCPGVSKVGSYTGTGTTQTINCGFTAGARFVLIKRTDDTGDWYVWDSARGIVAGNDPYLLLNSTAAEVTSTDYVDTAATGFEITSTAPAAINASGGTFIFLAIA